MASPEGTGVPSPGRRQPITPQAMLEGRQQEIWAQRDPKFEAARWKRQRRRLASSWQPYQIPGNRPPLEVQ